MRGEEVDERDSWWELSDPRFRVCVFTGVGNSVRTVDITEASVEEALDAARALADDDRHLWSSALVSGDGSGRRGRIWLSGTDDDDRVSSAVDVRRRRQMQERYLSARARRGEPPVQRGITRGGTAVRTRSCRMPMAGAPAASSSPPVYNGNWPTQRRCASTSSRERNRRAGRRPLAPGDFDR